MTNDRIAAAEASNGASLLAGSADLSTRDFLAACIRREFPGEIALVSSFGAEAAVLLHMIAAIDRSVPVIFLDSGKLFAETVAYRDRLVRHLGLADIRSVTPDASALNQADPDGRLWQRDPDRCCSIRKVEPLARALEGFRAWINGRKRYQGGARSTLPLIEQIDGRIKINPLIGWTADAIGAYFARHDLPHHPLAAQGYTSIGCVPCTAPASPGDDVRAGRWRGTDKTECGIHIVGNTIQRRAQ